MKKAKGKKPKFDATTTISAEFGIFGIPLSYEESQVILLPVPWEVTTSYGKGASWGPALIRQASEQIDLFDLETGKAYESGYHMLDFPKGLKTKNDLYKRKAQELIRLLTNLSENNSKMNQLRKSVNQACAEMSLWVYEQSKTILSHHKILGLVGGDHSTPLGAIKALSEKYKQDFAVLHFDAHADLRKSYQGFQQSHASIMYNVMTDPLKPKKLVQVGIRDFCEEEFEFIQSRKDIKTFFDLDLKRALIEGKSWSQLTQEIIKELPQNVYISFDIDGLDPKFCPNTGTPVPGGLSIEEAFYIFREIVHSGRKIIGFDVNEVSTGGAALKAADEWDGNVGARILYKLCGWAVLSANN